MTTTIETTERERVAFAAVELARHPDRPRALQVIAAITGGWTELRGDRLFGDDRAVVGGAGGRTRSRLPPITSTGQRSPASSSCMSAAASIRQIVA